MSADTTSDSISPLPAPSLLHPLKISTSSSSPPCGTHAGDIFNNVSPVQAFGAGAPGVSENKRSRERLQDGRGPDDVDVAIGQGRVRPVGFCIFSTATERVDDSLGINSLARSPL